MFLTTSLLLAGCGKLVPLIGSPADGSKIALDQTPYFQVALADTNAYQDTTIEVRGVEQFGQDLSCTPGNMQPALCQSRMQNGFGGGFSQNCTVALPCTLTLIARRGDLMDVKTISVSRTSQQNGGAPTAPR